MLAFLPEAGELLEQIVVSWPLNITGPSDEPDAKFFLRFF